MRSIVAPLTFVGFVLSVAAWFMVAFGAAQPWRATWLVLGGACVCTGLVIEGWGDEDKRELTDAGLAFAIVLLIADIITIGVGGAS